MKKEKKLIGGLITIAILMFLTSLFTFIARFVYPIPNSYAIPVIIVFMLLGIGILKLNDFARMIIIALYGVMAIYEVGSLISGRLEFGNGVLIRTVIEVVVIIYLTKPKIKVLFN